MVMEEIKKRVRRTSHCWTLEGLMICSELEGQIIFIVRVYVKHESRLSREAKSFRKRSSWAAAWSLENTMIVTVKRKLDRDIRNNYPFGERVRLVVHGDELRYHGSCLYRRLNRRRLHGRTAKVSTRRTEGNKLYVTLLLLPTLLYIFSMNRYHVARVLSVTWSFYVRRSSLWNANIPDNSTPQINRDTSHPSAWWLVMLDMNRARAGLPYGILRIRTSRLEQLRCMRWSLLTSVREKNRCQQAVSLIGVSHSISRLHNAY